VECARLLREGGRIIIVDPVILHERTPGLTGYMANSSIDGVYLALQFECVRKTS